MKASIALCLDVIIVFVMYHVYTAVYTAIANAQNASHCTATMLNDRHFVRDRQTINFRKMELGVRIGIDQHF